jgi:hypothetical protein
LFNRTLKNLVVPLLEKQLAAGTIAEYKIDTQVIPRRPSDPKSGQLPPPHAKKCQINPPKLLTFNQA